MAIRIEGKRFYRTNEACKKAGISRATFFRWLKEGVVGDVQQTDRRGWRLFSDEDIDRLKKEAHMIRKAPVQQQLNFIR